MSVVCTLSCRVFFECDLIFNAVGLQGKFLLAAIFVGAVMSSVSLICSNSMVTPHSACLSSLETAGYYKDVLTSSRPSEKTVLLDRFGCSVRPSGGRLVGYCEQ